MIGRKVAADARLVVNTRTVICVLAYDPEFDVAAAEALTLADVARKTP